MTLSITTPKSVSTENLISLYKVTTIIIGTTSANANGLLVVKIIIE